MGEFSLIAGELSEKVCWPPSEVNVMFTGASLMFSTTMVKVLFSCGNEHEREGRFNHSQFLCNLLGVCVCISFCQ